VFCKDCKWFYRSLPMPDMCNAPQAPKNLVTGNGSSTCEWQRDPDFDGRVFGISHCSKNGLWFDPRWIWHGLLP